MISLIVAVAENGVIGDRNALLWHISEDLRHFKAVTTGHPVVMGRKTWESLGRPLPNRTNVVITRQNIEIPGCTVAHSLEEAKQLQAEHGGFIKTMWCGELECELKMKEEGGMSSRCMPLKQEHLGDTCPICGKPAKKMIYWGIAY